MYPFVTIKHHCSCNPFYMEPNLVYKADDLTFRNPIILKFESVFMLLSLTREPIERRHIIDRLLVN